MAHRRDIPLERCPDAACRRAGLCRATHAKKPCRRLFMTDDEFREELACHLERLFVEWGGDPRELDHPPPDVSDDYMPELYKAISERAASLAAEERAPKRPRRRT